MHQTIYERLKEVARRKVIVYYHEIAPLAGLDMSNPAHRNEIADILGEISRYDVMKGRPMLSAVVVLKETGMPGKGFFTLARELKRFKGTDQNAFFVSELGQVHSTWANK